MLSTLKQKFSRLNQAPHPHPFNLVTPLLSLLYLLTILPYIMLCVLVRYQMV